MKRFIIAITSSLLVLGAMPAWAQIQASGDAFLENPAYNQTGNVGSYGQVGGNFQVIAADVPAGDTLYVTALGYYLPGGTPSVSTTPYPYYLQLYGPQTSAGGSFSSLSLENVVLPAGTTVDANDFAWITLGTPLALTPGDFYLMLAAADGHNVSYLQPYDNGSTGHASITPDVNGVVNPPFYMAQGAYNNGGGYAYTWSEYLGPDLQYAIEGPTPVPEPSTLALLVSSVAMTVALVSRRRPMK